MQSVDNHNIRNTDKRDSLPRNTSNQGLSARRKDRENANVKLYINQWRFSAVEGDALKGQRLLAAWKKDWG